MTTEPLSGESRPRALGAEVMLTAYVVLLLAIPSGVTISGLGTYGRPSSLWGLLLLGWWVLWRLEGGTTATARRHQPARNAVVAFVVVALVSFAQAMMRGQPPDQISPAIAALVRLGSWCGVFLVALDGIVDVDDVARIVRRLVMASGLLAILGLMQFVSHRSLLDWVGGIPGLQYGTEEEVGSRGVFVRAIGTSIHPLEFGTVLVGTIPLALSAAMSNGFRRGRPVQVRWWLAAGLSMIVCLISVSRSAIIGLVVAILASMPALSRRERRILLAGGVVATGMVAVAVPGMATTVIAMFTGASDDPSTQSRSDALARVPEFLSASPVLGAGFGTFLPRYYIFDNQWVLTLVELGTAGIAALAAIFVTGIWSAVSAARCSQRREVTEIGPALAASILTLAVLYAFFDAFSFPMSAGLLFLLTGLSAALYRMTEPRGEGKGEGDRGRSAALVENPSA